MALDTTMTLIEQQQGESLEYRVLTANKAGTSPASNAIAVVL
ncbi:hypothetical protein [Rubellicoccus peritrichatus]|uniref:Uncharacterized protein n=1 Tax=Rubellicoccus peritrichatus TaxID=3080537 RepID=A0AAQ3QR65_9BACT|nr:hypothetical protein [Puniceicoccus sp. CR14]WOO41003.1 hypothetical protein RZN69_20480 [Puniceicoccus sp. CR14]